MELTQLSTALLSTEASALPAPLVARIYLGLAWGLVLAALALVLLRRRGMNAMGLQYWLPLLLLLCCLLPGGLSPAFWLGLAFRAPSGLLVAVCGWVLLQHYRPQAPGVSGFEHFRGGAPALIVLGWALLLDTFALWPVSLYAWGFTPLALGALVLLGYLPWLLRGNAILSGGLIAALLLHVFLRLPSGNVWDAVLDPWLWLLLQADWLWRKLRRS
ncbi:MAG: hypothetical protein Q8R72_04800 [Hylemonella sp.]|nr:hypothetical protein [Hylemonella sp.]